MVFRDLVLFCLALVGLYFVSGLAYRKRRYLLKNGIPATAKVSDISKTLIEIGTSYVSARSITKVVLEIETPGAAGRLLTIRQDFETWEIPELGDTVEICIDPRNPDNVLIISAPPNSAFSIRKGYFLNRFRFTIVKQRKTSK